MSNYYNVAQIIVSVALVIMVLLQVRGGGLGGIFGQPDTTFRVRRGLEKTMFQFTIVLVIIFITISILSVAKPW
jgi:preprotein translocase subunit SecG